MKKEKWLQRWGLLFGAGGFLLTFTLTLISGSSWMTALIRGGAGFIGLWVCGWIVKWMLRDLLPSGRSQAGEKIDLSLPEEIPPMQRSQESNEEDSDSFVPLVFGQGNAQLGTRHGGAGREQPFSSKEVTDEQARKLAEALRSLQK